MPLNVVLKYYMLQYDRLPLYCTMIRMRSGVPLEILLSLCPTLPSDSYSSKTFLTFISTLDTVLCTVGFFIMFKS